MPTYTPTPQLLVTVALAACAFVGVLVFVAWRRLQRRYAVLLAQLAERERAAVEVQDSMLQGMQGVLLSFYSVSQRLPPGSAARDTIEQLLDRGDAALARGRQQLLALRAAGANEGAAAPSQRGPEA